jgi:PHD/YefM family antitoxin component YafN of YafNO toxin-antitoxin module
MRVYAYSQAGQNLASFLDQAAAEGEVRIKRKDGQLFVVKPQPQQESSLDVETVDLGVTTNEIVDFIRESRERTSRVSV